MKWNRLTTAQEIIEFHYGDIRNVSTPVVVGYGWIIPGTVAYELSTNEDKTRWGVTAITYNYRGTLAAPQTWYTFGVVFETKEQADDFILSQALVTP
jgi:hypothetical protein